ncbi:branched-chain amino acid ABC transporter substrate-binding protein [Campylobacter sp. MIT 99-7217]|uniref:ABC transporter substrate-binding protein n=1 Tax=Campylobacter sp. MIT 99-7217 TaxID=535091 RepID=UPI0011596651|nr:ABC transporter substrate-binding protein [Campylobacter sp. MIT 99-7217]TQR33714.1 branched-chain amino acid ABC transporter substrate-binding protein [Campylobacter sp. MIT 99-7217]
MKKFHLSLCALALTSFVYAKEVKIGVVLPLSGATAAYGQSALEGIKIAHLMQNTLKNGDKVELVTLDSRGDKVESATAATRLIAQDKVLGFIGEMVTANTLQIMRVAEDKKIPLIAPAATSDKLLNGKKYSSRVCFMDSFQGSSLAKYAFKDLSYKKAVIVMDQSTDYSLGLAKAFEKEFKQNGGEILAKLRVSSGDKDYKAVIAQIANLKPDFIYLPIYYNEAALFVRQAKNVNLNIAMGSADGVADETFIKLAKDASNGYIFTDSFDYTNPTTKLSKEFIAEFEKKNKTKEVPNFSAMGADAYFVMFEAMNKCTHDLTSECINKQIHSTSNFQGVSGIINIDQSGNASRSVVVKEIQNEKQTYKATINP